MRLPKLKTILLVPIALFSIVYIVGALVFLFTKPEKVPDSVELDAPLEIAIFGASGTAGDGILKAALATDDINKIYVITRRLTDRIQAGVNAGKVQIIMHSDYLNYADIIHKLSTVDSVFWAIGITSLGTDEKTYGMIHVDFPLSFLQALEKVNNKTDISFHFISSSDISEDSTTMWVREKIRAEKTLFKFAENSNLRVIAYRPDYIGPTKEEASLGQNLLYWFFKPVGAAIKAREIGQAMIDIASRGNSIKHGTKLSTRKIIQYSDLYMNQNIE